MDIVFGDINGIDVVKILILLWPEMMFMMYTVHEENQKIFEALSAGAGGYIIKKTARPGL